MILGSWDAFTMIRLERGDKDFYAMLGKFFGSRLAAKELGMPIYDDPGRIWVVTLNEIDPVACSSIEIKGDKANMKSAWVEPDWRGHGIYNNMFEARLKIAKQAGVKTITSVVTDKSYNTHLRHGFKEVGRRGRYYIMKKEMGESV